MLLIIAIPTSLMTALMGISGVVTMDLKMLAVAAACTVGAVVSVRAYVRQRDVTQSPLVRLIRERPDQLVWIYIRKQRVNGLVHETVHVHGASRQLFVLQSLEPSQLLAELTAWCPHAHVGWSRELDDAWMRDPTSLWRGAA